MTGSTRKGQAFSSSTRNCSSNCVASGAKRSASHGNASESPTKCYFSIVVNYHAHLDRNPRVCAGQAVFKGMRVTLRTVLASIADGDSVETILQAYRL